MAACGEPGEDAALYDTVAAVAMELCPALGIGIPVGKDSLSMRTRWTDAGTGVARQVTSPVSLVVTAFATLDDVRGTRTPQVGAGDRLLLIDLGGRRNRLGGSILAQVNALRDNGLLSAYHDRSDGGLWATACELAFASGLGLDLDVAALGESAVAALFAEELGAVVAVPGASLDAALAILAEHGLADLTTVVGAPNDVLRVRVRSGEAVLLDEAVGDLALAWDEVSWRISALRDNPATADEEHAAVGRVGDPATALAVVPAFDPGVDIAAPYLHRGLRPKVAILREQGVNSHVETAFAFDRAGFAAYDIHMTDLMAGRADLRDVTGLVACGGFSYGDTLGAGEGWARSVLFHPELTEAFATFFARPDTFGLGICNGCQMFAALADLIPGAAAWPRPCCGRCGSPMPVARSRRPIPRTPTARPTGSPR